MVVMQNRLFPKICFWFSSYCATALAHLLNMNKCIYISGEKWKNEGLQNFIKVRSPLTPPRLEPASPLHILCKKTIEVYSIKDLLGQWGWGGGGEHTFILKILKILIIPFLTGNINAFNHV